MRGGLIGSTILHVVLLALLLFRWHWVTQEPVSPERVIALNLVRLAASSQSPATAERAPMPQEQAREVAATDSNRAVPLPPAELARSAADRHADREAASLPPPTMKPAPKAELPQSVRRAKTVPPQAVKPRPAAQVDALAARLAALAQLREVTPPLPADPRRQEGSGESNVTAATADAGRALHATYSVKDFIRAQVERRWNLDERLADTDWMVAIHIVLLPDGSVDRAEIVDERRYRTNRAYFEFALSARNAVLLSSPIAVPAGENQMARDLVIDFGPKQVLQ